ncbi:hypothetical protein Q5P01_016574 [Channa striata]|uniref:Uncharacterized protein n=1 Tax=Channa striata TaxID=64152 RepID=A0AA88SBR8_CHASR|nr:hypothetical protein Q5P01_016574 [Channa striata]
MDIKVPCNMQLFSFGSGPPPFALQPYPGFYSHPKTKVLAYRKEVAKGLGLLVETIARDLAQLYRIRERFASLRRPPRVQGRSSFWLSSGVLRWRMQTSDPRLHHQTVFGHQAASHGSFHLAATAYFLGNPEPLPPTALSCPGHTKPTGTGSAAATEEGEGPRVTAGEDPAEEAALCRASRFDKRSCDEKHATDDTPPLIHCTAIPDHVNLEEEYAQVYCCHP